MFFLFSVAAYICLFLHAIFVQFVPIIPHLFYVSIIFYCYSI